MSKNSVIVLLMTKEPVKRVADFLEKRLLIKLEKDPDPAWEGRILRYTGCGFRIRLDDNHELEDDYGIAFSAYPIGISIESYRQGPQSIWEPLENSMAIYVGELLHKEFQCKCIVVENLAKVIHSFVKGK